MENESAAAAFGQRVKELRKARGWTQARLAESMSRSGRGSYHQTTIAKLESGARPTSIDELVDLAGILGVGIEDLFRDEVRKAVEIAQVGRQQVLLNQIELDVYLYAVRIDELREQHEIALDEYHSMLDELPDEDRPKRQREAGPLVEELFGVIPKGLAAPKIVREV